MPFMAKGISIIRKKYYEKKILQLLLKGKSNHPIILRGKFHIAQSERAFLDQIGRSGGLILP